MAGGGGGGSGGGCSVTNAQSAVPLPDAVVRRARAAVLAALATEEARGWVDVSFVDDVAMRELNRRYRGLDETTDVLAFALREPGEGEPPEVTGEVPGEPAGGAAGWLLGDVVISLPEAARQAEAAGHSLADEVALLAVHGTLHLLGHDHDDPERKRLMWECQAKALARVART